MIKLNDDQTECEHATKMVAAVSMGAANSVSSTCTESITEKTLADSVINDIDLSSI